MKIYLLHERWADESEDTIIGVYSTPEKALEKMKLYYGEYEEVKTLDLDDDAIYFSKTIVAKDCYNENMKLVLTLMIFHLDEI